MRFHRLSGIADGTDESTSLSDPCFPRAKVPTTVAYSIAGVGRPNANCLTAANWPRPFISGIASVACIWAKSGVAPSAV